MEEIGKTYGNLTILSKGSGTIEKDGHKRSTVVCKCTCGTEDEFILKDLKRGNNKYCRNHNKSKDYTGKCFGDFCIIKEVDSIHREYSYGSVKERRFIVKCSFCNEEKESNLHRLRLKPKCSKRKKPVLPSCRVFNAKKFYSKYPHLKVIEVLGEVYKGHKLSILCECGIQFNSSTESLSKSVYKRCKKCGNERKYKNKELKKNRPYWIRLNSVYNTIKQRCYNKNNHGYSSYGNRGIKMSNEWLNDFETFYNDIINMGYKSGLEIDRIDNDKGYSKENCQCITPEENKLKQGVINLTKEDVIFIRSDEFNWDKHRKNYTCSDFTINNIIDKRTFLNVGT